MYIYSLSIRLHAGVSTIEPQIWQAIPFSAFIDAVEDYEADSETDDEGDMMNAWTGYFILYYLKKTVFYIPFSSFKIISIEYT